MFDQQATAFLQDVERNRGKLPSVAAIFRVKNAQDYLALSVLSVAPVCSKIVIVDNGSSDDTVAVVERLLRDLSGKVEISLYSYPHEVVLPGIGYKDRLAVSPLGSLAEYYEYCFGLGGCDYLMKVDAHYIFMPSGLFQIQNKLKNNVDIIRFRGTEIFGRSLDFEPFLFRSTLGYRFVDGDFYEELVFDRKESLVSIFRSIIWRPVFLHVKRLKFFEFSHAGAFGRRVFESLYRKNDFRE